jgi:hypothetical protein
VTNFFKGLCEGTGKREQKLGTYTKKEIELKMTSFACFILFLTADLNEVLASDFEIKPIDSSSCQNWIFRSKEN